MPERLSRNQALDANALALVLNLLTPEVSVGSVELARFGTHGVGIWEHTPGVSTDVEIDEVFIVLQGEATVAFDDGTPPLHLHPGVVGRLTAGARTTWTVTETLRKVYLA